MSIFHNFMAVGNQAHHILGLSGSSFFKADPTKSVQQVWIAEKKDIPEVLPKGWFKCSTKHRNEFYIIPNGIVLVTSEKLEEGKDYIIHSGFKVGIPEKIIEWYKAKIHFAKIPVYVRDFVRHTAEYKERYSNIEVKRNNRLSEILRKPEHLDQVVWDTFVSRLRAADTSYHYSDDRNSYREGRMQEDSLLATQKSLGVEGVVEAYYKLTLDTDEFCALQRWEKEKQNEIVIYYS